MSSLLRICGYLIIVGVVPMTLARGQDVRAIAERVRSESSVRQSRFAALTNFQREAKGLKSLTDTMYIAGGNVAVLSQRDMLDLAKAAAADADTMLGRVRSLVPGIHGAEAAIQLDSSGQYAPKGVRMAVIRFSIPQVKGASVAFAEPKADDIARVIEDNVVNRALGKAGTPIGTWRRGNIPLRDADRGADVDWAAVRFDVLSSPSTLDNRCYEGELPACSMLLGLTTVDDPVMAWYDSTARWNEVDANRTSAARVDRVATDECLRGNDPACGRVLHAIRRLEQPPGGSVARGSLLLEAARMGGEGALDRMLSSRGTPAEAIAAGANAPIDSVLRQWNRHVREGSVGSGSITLAMVAVALGWIALLALLASRISRWR